MTFSLRDIQLFVAVYEELSFTAAAERENATQSGASQHIRKMEEHAGVQLFLRGTREVVPTPAADRFFRRCIELLRTHDLANSELQAFKNGFNGEISIGLMYAMTNCVLGPALVRFRKMHPNVVVNVTEASSEILTEKVRADDMTFAIVPASPNNVGVKSKYFASTPEFLVSAAQSRFEPFTPVQLSQTGPLKVVLPGQHNPRRQTMDTYLASYGANCADMLQLDAVLGIFDFVSLTDWVTIMPGVMMASEMNRGRFTLNLLTGPELNLDLVLIHSARRGLPPAAEEMKECLLVQMERISRQIAAKIKRQSEIAPNKGQLPLEASSPIDS
jgi:LysR family nitrogen assimilation transcriptional regulator